MLATVALSHFLITSAITSVYYSLASDSHIFQSWKENGLPLSITHFVGALFAGLAYVIWTSGNYFAGAIAVLILAVLYLSYRQIMANMTGSLEAAAKAEKEKTELEREKRIQVEKYAGELTTALLKEESTSRALRESENAFRHAALHDALTNLPNRTHFSQRLQREMHDAATSPGFVFFLDLSRFKTVNDTLGHGTGDRVLEVAAMRFKAVLGPEDFAARIGGDEFAMVVRSVRDAAEAEDFAWKVHRKLSDPISIEGQRVNIGINIGVAPLTDDYKFPEEILRDADIAMHYASGRGTGVEMFSAEIRDASLKKARIEADLPSAIERSEFVIHYQPLISLKDGSLIGAEALLRWEHPSKGLVSPGEFIPVAEESGLIVPMTRWILDRACRDLSDWHRDHPRHQELLVSVNISGRHLAHQSLLGDVKSCLERTGLEPRHLKLEITETVAMDNPEESKRAFNELKDLGVQLSIDDFGTGYSSLSYLHELPFDTLKIDRSFVNNVGENGENSEVLETIVALAKNLRMRVIAEGIETVEQLGLLRSLGCDYGQGFLMSKPMPVEHFVATIAEKDSWLPRPQLPDGDFPADDSPRTGNVIPLH